MINEKTPSSDKKRILRGLLALASLAALGVALYFLVGKPLIRFAGDTARFRAWVDGSGVWGRLGFLGMMIAQIIVAFIPGEPLEIAAGAAFGVVEGTGLCMLGALIGGTAVFLFTRRFGMRFASAFFPMEKLERAPLLNNPKRLSLCALILFLIPGTPKDLMTYCAGLTSIRLGLWCCITSLARFPSIITSTLGGDALGMGRTGFALAVFAATMALSAAGLLVYRRLSRG